MARLNCPTAERLRELLHYDPETGLLTWRVNVGSRGKAGAIAGKSNKIIRYVQVGIDGSLYYAHQVVWAWMTGAWPQQQIDHKDRARDNNRFANLREATDAANRQNMGLARNNTSGVTGVWFNKANGNWCAEIKLDRRKRHLGSFATLEDASAARAAAKRVLHPFAAGAA